MAIMVAVLATILFGTAALVVDLGTNWVRQRQLQTQADVSALSVGDLMPAPDPVDQAAVAARVASYLAEPANQVPGQPATSAGQLLDGNQTNGEITFTADGEQFELRVPQTTVQFTFARMLGVDKALVSARAVVRLGSETPSSVLPFWLPNGCPYGPLQPDTTGGGGGGGSKGGGGGGGSKGGGGLSGSGVDPSQGPDFSSTAAPDTAEEGEEFVPLVFTVNNTSDLQSNKQPDVRFEGPGGEQHDASGSWVSQEGGSWTFTATIGSADVTSVAGQWQYQTVVGNGSKQRFSGVENFNVQPGDAGDAGDDGTSVSCVGSSRGNFGQLESPRDPPTTKKNRLALNIALGLDHRVDALLDHGYDECTGGRAGEQLDDASRDGNTCIMPDPGNDGPGLYEGFVGGVAGHPGRVAAANGDTRPGCNGGNTAIGSVTINNDLLSCYLTNDDLTLSDLMQDDGVTTEMLDPAVINSPRFVWLPVVYRNDRSSKTWQPIKRFVPGFITDETGPSTRTSSNRTDDNGIYCNGGGTCKSLSSVQVFSFNADALPIDERNAVSDYDEELGRETLRLID